MDEGRTMFPLCVDDLLDRGGEFRNALEELADSLFPLLDVWGFVVEKMIDKLSKIFGFGDIFVGDASPGLVEHGALGCLEDDVVGGVTSSELGLDFAVEIVFFVLRLPVAMSQVKCVEQRAVYNDAFFGSLDRELRNEGEMELSSAVGEELGEGVADLGFVVEVRLSDLIESGLVVLYRDVRRLEGKGHLWRLKSTTP